jgi:hypothetical protein
MVVTTRIGNWIVLSRVCGERIRDTAPGGRTFRHEGNFQGGAALTSPVPIAHHQFDPSGQLHPRHFRTPRSAQVFGLAPVFRRRLHCK